MMKICQLIKLKLLFFIIIFPLSSNAELFTYQLKFVQAKQVIPVMQPHLSVDSNLTGKKNLLFADVSEADNQKIISMLAQLDKQLTQYLVQVKITNHQLDEWEKKATKVYRSKQPNIKKYSTDSLSKNNQHFKLRLTEGNQGFINTGESFPSHQIITQHDKFLPKTSHRKVSSGFYVVVRESQNNQVTLNVSASAQQRKGSSDTNFSAANSQIIGNKNEWLLLASTGSETNHQAAVQAHKKSSNYSTQSMSQSGKWYYVKVTEQD
jgi:hypothetical protein